MRKQTLVSSLTTRCMLIELALGRMPIFTKCSRASTLQITSARFVEEWTHGYFCLRYFSSSTHFDLVMRLAQKVWRQCALVFARDLGFRGGNCIGLRHKHRGPSQTCLNSLTLSAMTTRTSSPCSSPLPESERPSWHGLQNQQRSKTCERRSRNSSPHVQRLVQSVLQHLLATCHSHMTPLAAAPAANRGCFSAVGMS